MLHVCVRPGLGHAPKERDSAIECFIIRTGNISYLIATLFYTAIEFKYWAALYYIYKINARL
jgi:hypothetical protein